MLRNDNAPTVVFDGTWDFRLGIAGAWSTIRVPGCWEAQGYSKWVDGPAEYRRVFTLTDQWAGSRVLLEFDAVSYACTVHVNGQKIGVHCGIWTPFSFDITASVNFGGENLLSVIVYKPGAHHPLRSTLAGGRAGMGGYVVIGIRDTSIATSGVLDDFGQPKWPAPAFLSFNDDAILCLATNRRRSWHAGGDRPERGDLHTWWSGSEASFQIILNNAGRPLHPGAALQWQFTEPGGAVVGEGNAALPAHGTLGAPYRIATITFQLPEVQEGAAFRLRVWLTDPVRSIQNQWPIWIFPHPAPWPGPVAIYDPSYTLASWGEPSLGSRRQWSGQGQHPARVVLATALDEQLIQYVADGGATLLLQQHDGPLPARRVPFWRESIKLIYPHPVWQQFPHEGYADLQFFGMATDIALITEQLHTYLPAINSVRPILRRLDAREFHISDYLVELEIGAGRMLVSKLRHQGGAGAQPTGIERNVAGYLLLDAVVAYLLQGSDSKEKETQA